MKLLPDAGNSLSLLLKNSGIMQINDLKYNLIDKLISIRDISLLERINALIGNVDLEKTPLKVSEKQRQMLMDSEADINNGRVISDEALNEEENKWLNGSSGL